MEPELRLFWFGFRRICSKFESGTKSLMPVSSGSGKGPMSGTQMPKNDMINWIILMNCCVSSQLQCFVSEKKEQIDGFQVIKCTAAIALI